jgi:hypothetical protein
MMLRFRRLHDALGVEVLGLDLAGAIDAAARDRLRDTFLRRHLLLVESLPAARCASGSAGCARTMSTTTPRSAATIGEPASADAA